MSECGHEISDKAPFCPSCGVAIAGRTITCPLMRADLLFRIKKECPQMPPSDTAASTGRDNGDTRQPKRKQGARQTQQQDHTDNIARHCRRNRRIVLVDDEEVRNDKESTAYEYAMTSDNAQVLQDYLAHTDAPEEHRDSIEAHLAILQQAAEEWTNAVISGSKAALQQYIDASPPTHRSRQLHCTR